MLCMLWDVNPWFYAIGKDQEMPLTLYRMECVPFINLLVGENNNTFIGLQKAPLYVFLSFYKIFYVKMP